MIRLGHTPNTFLEKMVQKTGVKVLDCYQCGKCVGSCPVASHMTATPRQIMQLIKLVLSHT